MQELYGLSCKKYIFVAMLFSGTGFHIYVVWNPSSLSLSNLDDIEYRLPFIGGQSWLDGSWSVLVPIVSSKSNISSSLSVKTINMVFFASFDGTVSLKWHFERRHILFASF